MKSPSLFITTLISAIMIGTAICLTGAALGTLYLTRDYRQPTPTPAPTSTPSYYLDDALFWISKNNEAMAQLLVLLEPQPLPVDDMDWLQDIGIQTGTVQGAYQEMQLLTPPPEYAELHNLTLFALNICDQSTRHLEKALIEEDEGEFDSYAETGRDCAIEIERVLSGLID